MQVTPTQPITVSEVAVSQSNVQVVGFHVWQDLTPASRNNSPVYATVTIELSDAYDVSHQSPDATIRLEATNGETLLEGRLAVNRAHFGLGLALPGRKQVQFTMLPAPMYGRMRSPETVRGAARIRIGGRLVAIRLPEAKVIFTW